MGEPHNELTDIPLPGASSSVRMDYLAIDRDSGRVWIPAADTGDVDVLDPGATQIRHVAHLPTVVKQTKKGARTLGPTAAALVAGTAWIGNRADSRVCGFVQSGAAAGCVSLPSSPDGLAAVPSRREVWATAPNDRELVVIDVHDPAAPTIARVIPLPEAPEGYAVDEHGGRFFTNVEETSHTMVVDLVSGNVTATWPNRCADGTARGVAYDPAAPGTSGIVIVACQAQLVTLDGATGKPLGVLGTGSGVDNIDFVASSRVVFAAAGQSRNLTIARVEESGTFSPITVLFTMPGTRVVVAAADGTAYVADPERGKILVAKPPAHGW